MNNLLCQYLNKIMHLNKDNQIKTLSRTIDPNFFLASLKAKQLNERGIFYFSYLYVERSVCYFHHSYLFFSFSSSPSQSQSHGTAPPFKKLILQKLMVAPKKPFPDTLGHFGSPWQPFWIFEVLMEEMIESKCIFCKS